MSNQTRDIPVDPEPEPINRGDSVERTGLWKAGNGGGGTHFPDHLRGEII